MDDGMELVLLWTGKYDCGFAGYLSGMDHTAAGWSVANIDATAICERPKLRPKVDAIRARIAEILGLDASAVSVKGKTNEGMDAAGAGLGVVCHAVALITRI